MAKELTTEIDKVTIPEGFTFTGIAAGLKGGDALDVGVLACDTPCNAAAVFTKNLFKGAPLYVGMENIKDGLIQAVVVNSKNANVDTGKEGLTKARRVCEKVAAELAIEAGAVFPSSTGVIGRQLPIEQIESSLDGLKGKLSTAGYQQFAESIMTTDTRPKVCSVPLGDGVLLGFAKGAGMIEPNMATMLSYIITDVEVAAGMLDKVLKAVTEKTFNCVSVDTDTSTSDTVLVMASGTKGKVSEEELTAALYQVGEHLAVEIARDGEGASKLITVDCIGALDYEQAKTIAKIVVNSPLVKTAIKGADPNWGRLIMAVGKSFDERIKRDSLRINVVDPGSENKLRLGEEGNDLKALEALFRKEHVKLEIDLGLGDAKCRVWGCDLTEDYIHINADYTT